MSDLNRLVRSRLGTGKIVTPAYEDYLATNNNMLFSQQLIEEVVLGDLNTPQRDRTQGLSASSLGRCQREHLYQYFGVKGVGHKTAMMPIFHNGTFVHLRWQLVLRHQGVLDHVEVPLVKTFDGVTLKGTSDGIGVLPIDDATEDDLFIWEMKSINSFGFKSVMDYGPKKEHLYQFHAYMLMAGINNYSIVYEDKNTQDYIEYTGVADPKIFDEVRAEIATLTAGVHAPEKLFPTMLDDCWSKKGYQYNGCPYRKICHKHEAGEDVLQLAKPKMRIRKP